MFVVRNVFRTHPGKAKELVKKFQAAAPHFKKIGIHNTRVLSDAVAGFWTVVHEVEVEDMNAHLKPERPMRHSARQWRDTWT